GGQRLWSVLRKPAAYHAGVLQRCGGRKELQPIGPRFTGSRLPAAAVDQPRSDHALRRQAGGMAGSHNRTSITVRTAFSTPILSAAGHRGFTDDGRNDMPGVWGRAARGRPVLCCLWRTDRVDPAGHGARLRGSQGDGRGDAMTSCSACNVELRPTAKFCDECGAAVSKVSKPAEYKQVTVLFADVVHSMDIATAVGPERLREIMTELVECATDIVTRYGGTVNQFTGDGLMAVFGAPLALEDHALRACLAALGIQEEAKRVASDVQRRNALALQLRIGLNSGAVIAGEIGTGALGYTAIGDQVGMAQRMESVAPAGGVMLSDSTARLVENSVVLGDAELVRIKNIDTPVRARQLLAVGEHQRRHRSESKLVGRTWELNTATAILEETTRGLGGVVNIVGPAGIGKSRLVREVTAIASARNIPVFSTYCESHTSDVPFHVIARLIRATSGLEGLDRESARERLRERMPHVDSDDVRILEDLLGIRDTAEALPAIAPDARRRRLTALINAGLAARTEPAVVVEDAHWIDEASESMLTEFMAVVSQTPSLMLITYRPEYVGALTRVPGTQTIALRPLTDEQVSALSAELLGADPSLDGLTSLVADRAAGNPFLRRGD